MKIVESKSYLTKMYYKLTNQINVFELERKTKSIVVTSSDMETSTMEFIKSFVDELKSKNKKVLLIDANFRGMNLKYSYNVDSETGLSDIVNNQKIIEECIIKKDGIDILMSGYVSVNPEEVIGSQSMKNIINKVKMRYDYVIINTSPIGIYSDAWVLSSFADKTVFIKGKDEETIKESMSRLSMIGANFISGYYGDRKDSFNLTSTRSREAVMA